MFVDGVDIWPAAEPHAARTKSALDGQTWVFRAGMRVDTAQLVVGKRVTVWISGMVPESCPPAARVLLDD